MWIVFWCVQLYNVFFYTRLNICGIMLECGVFPSTTDTLICLHTVAVLVEASASRSHDHRHKQKARPPKAARILDHRSCISWVKFAIILPCICNTLYWIRTWPIFGANSFLYIPSCAKLVPRVILQYFHITWFYMHERCLILTIPTIQFLISNQTLDSGKAWEWGYMSARPRGVVHYSRWIMCNAKVEWRHYCQL